MNGRQPVAAFGHFAMKVMNIDASYKFYFGLGLRPFGRYPGLGIIELRGGSDILLLDKRDAQPFSIESGHLGQRSAFFNEHLDLMIEGRSRDDPARFRTSLVEKGLSVDEIADDQLFGHDYFELSNPDGNGITFYTSHTADLPQ